MLHTPDRNLQNLLQAVWCSGRLITRLQSSDAEWECSVKKLNPSRQTATCIPCFHSHHSPICLFKIANYHSSVTVNYLLRDERAPSSSTHRCWAWVPTKGIHEKPLIWVFFHGEGNKNCVWLKAPTRFVNIIGILCLPWQFFSFLCWLPCMCGGKRCRVDSLKYQLCREGPGSPAGQRSWLWSRNVPLWQRKSMALWAALGRAWPVGEAGHP